MLKRFAALVGTLLVSVCPAQAETDEGLADRCFHLGEAQIVNNYQYCARDEKRPRQGRFDCISQHWSRSQDGEYQSKHFGWVTLKDGKRHGPAELVLDAYSLGGSPGDANESRVKLSFQEDRLEGTVKITHPTSKARCEIPFHQGRVEGVVRVVSAKGKLVAAREVIDRPTGSAYRAPFEIRFCRDGKLSVLHCALSSKTAEDKGPCGFGAKEPVETPLHSCSQGVRTVTYWVKDGRIVKKLVASSGVRDRNEALAVTSDDEDDDGDDVIETTDDTTSSVMTVVYDPPVGFGESPVSEKVEVRYPSGKPMLRYQTKKQFPVERLEYFGKNGKLLTEAKFTGDQGEMIQYAESFLNGQPKLVAKTTGKRGETSVLRSFAEAPERVEECVYVDVPESAGYGYDYDRQRLRIDLSRFGIHAAYLMEPRECRVLIDREEVATSRYLNGLPHGEQTEIDREAQRKIITTYEKGKLKRVKTVRLGSGADVLEEYRVFEDGSREYVKRQARKGI